MTLSFTTTGRFIPALKEKGMEKFKNYLLAASGFVVLLSVIAMTNVGHSAAQGVGDCLRICNPESAPIPIRAQGVTNIAGEVTVQSSEAAPVFTKQSGLFTADLFQKEVDITILPEQGGIAHQQFGVPAGKFLTIGYISGKTTSSKSTVEIHTVANGAGATHFLNLNPDGMGNFSQNVLIYADPGSSVAITYLSFPHFLSQLKLTLVGAFADQP
jgi:hypothetical protein